MAENSKSKFTASKVIAFFAVLIILKDGIEHFYHANDNSLYILAGILYIALAVIVFISLEFVNFRKIKIPYKFWILFIIAAFLFLIAFLGFGLYHGVMLLILAVAIDTKEFTTLRYELSKLVNIVGAFFAFYESILLIFSGNPVLTLNGVFGIILVIILILLIIEKINIKIKYTWWTILTIGFVFFMWITPNTFYGGAIGGILILIAFVLILMEY